MIKAIFFDFNGVIIDDEPIQLKAYQEVFAPVGIELSESDYYDCLGMDDRAFVIAAYARVGREVDESALTRLIDEKSLRHGKAIEGELPLFPGVTNFVKAASHHATLGIVSMARRVEIDDVLDRAGLRQSFDIVISAEDVNACKPNPACYLRGFTQVNELRSASGNRAFLPYECLAIEDSPPGIEAARAAGMHALGVTNTVDASLLRAAKAEIVTSSLRDLSFEAILLLFK